MAVKGTLGRVLLVDDDEDLRRASGRQLRTEGWSVVDVGNGRLAIDAMHEGREFFDCVISDVNVPEINGFEVSAGIRRWDDDLPVLLMTTGDDRRRSTAPCARSTAARSRTSRSRSGGRRRHRDTRRTRRGARLRDRLASGLAVREADARDHHSPDVRAE